MFHVKQSDEGMPSLRAGETHTVTVSGTTIEGDGIARIGGQVVFIPGALEAERCEIRITHVGRRAAYAELRRILEPSAHRILPDCPYHAQCGGCALRHMDYEAELAVKKQHVLDCLRRIGGVEMEDISIYGSAEQEHYRNKVQFPVQEQDGRVAAGFFRAGTHIVTDIGSCRIQPPCADRIRGAVLAWMQKYRIRAYNEQTHTGYIRHIYIRRGAVSGQILVCIAANCRKLPKQDALVRTVLAAEPGVTTIVFTPNEARGNTVLGTEFFPLYGSGTIEDTLCGLTFRLSAPAFYQVNHAQAERLYDAALRYAGLTGRETVLDLYCGTGTITLCLARQAKQAVGVELIPQAVEDARENARRNGLANARFFCTDAGQAAQRFCAEGTQPDVIVVDPPRKGVSADVIDAIDAMRPPRVVYVSCNAATLARDVKLLTERGYRLAAAEAYDLFPRCAHVETVCCLYHQKKDFISVPYEPKNAE